MSEFYVIIIDDIDLVCEKIKNKIEGGRILGQIDPIIPVKAKSIHISLSQLIKSDDILESKWTFGGDVGKALIEASAKKPDMIIVDYIYANPEILVALRKRGLQGTLSGPLMEDRTFTPIDLRKWIENQNHSTMSSSNRRSIINNIFNASCPVYMHSYTSQGTESILGNVDDRVRKIQGAFPKATINSIDTRKEFFNNEEFDWPTEPSRKDSKYYPYQLAVFFNQIVQKEIIRRELNKNKFLRVKRTTKSVTIITAIGAGIGFVASWIGGVLSELVRQQQYGYVVVIIPLLLGGLLLVGALIPLIFDHLMQMIMIPEEDQK